VSPTRVTVWGENVHEQRSDEVRAVYPEGMHTTIAAGLKTRLGDAVAVRTATLQEPEHGLTEDVLAATDVLTWWGHMAHDQVADGVVDLVQRRVLEGMGLLVLHSAHLSKPFRRLMGTSCDLRWRELDDEREVVWNVNPSHPITRGLPEAFVIPHQEMYGEFFHIPPPDELVFISSFTGGEVFRSGCVFHRGHGRVFYFSPGHETFPVYHQAEVQQVLANAVMWAAPDAIVPIPGSRQSPLGWFESTPQEVPS
jgi:trehalose utilization protein